MAVLPASVRVAVWGTAALAGHLAMSEVRGLALRDIHEVTGLTAQLELWHDLGERAMLVALPRPGDLTGLPSGSEEFRVAALEAEEAVFVPGLGGALVPVIEPYGPPGDRGHQARWTAYDCDPVPVHRVHALSLPEIESELRREVSRLTDELSGTRRAPGDLTELEQLVRGRAAEGPWGLPPWLLPRAVRVIELAGSVTALAQAGRDGRLQALDSSTTMQRERILHRLHDQAARSLAAATNVAALQLAGWR